MLGACLVLAFALAAPSAPAQGFSDFVNPLAGTEPGPGTFGGGHNFPGATVPFGMVQWSPDTVPANETGSGGYDYRNHHLKGFSLTHLSGAGCALYGDFPFLPTTEPLLGSPVATTSSKRSTYAGQLQPGFSHRGERARPGFYSMRLKPSHGAAIDTELTTTTRTGLGRFDFPSNPHSSILINAGGSAQPDDFASVQINPEAQEIDGSASSGLFCGQRPRYKVYFAAVFSRPFGAYGTWEGSALAPDRLRPVKHRCPNPTRQKAPTLAPMRPLIRVTARLCSPGLASPSSALRTLAKTLQPKTRDSPSGRSPPAPSTAGTLRWAGSASAAGPAICSDLLHRALSRLHRAADLQ